MIYSSTRGSDINLKFGDVLLNGLAKDGGLYVPNSIKSYSEDELDSLRELDYSSLAFELTKHFVLGEISVNEYKKICTNSYKKSFGEEIISFDKLDQHKYIANLFNGPTYAFKDFALQLLGNIYDYILRKRKIKLTILGATSGDTGSAAIHGCAKSNNVKIFILFPLNRVSEVQRKQMTTVKKKNVFNIAVKGNFDDCQRMVKNYFKLNNENKKINLAAVNSINWVRIMGQIVYYFWSYFRVSSKFDPMSFVVPSGNFGNAYAGYISKKMGLPIKKIIIGSNKNDILTRFFKTGKMKIKKTLTSLSPSMDIQVSSNFERLLFDFYENGKMIEKLFYKLENTKEFSVAETHLRNMRKTFGYGKISDFETKKTINQIFDRYKLIVDPHTAVGLSVGDKQLDKKERRIYLATAHYSKFIKTVKESVKKKVDYPDKLKRILKKKEKFEIIENNINQLDKLIVKQQ